MKITAIKTNGASNKRIEIKGEKNKLIKISPINKPMTAETTVAVIAF